MMAAMLALILGLSAAQAQPAGNGDHVIGTVGGSDNGRGAARERVPPPPPGAARVQEMWPRLDAGAVLCTSRDELTARARLLAAAEPGAAQMPPGCRLIRRIVGVTVVDRAPPAATEVKLRDSGEVGWTDAYLPEKPPGG